MWCECKSYPIYTDEVVHSFYILHSSNLPIAICWNVQKENKSEEHFLIEWVVDLMDVYLEQWWNCFADSMSKCDPSYIYLFREEVWSRGSLQLLNSPVSITMFHVQHFKHLRSPLTCHFPYSPLFFFACWIVKVMISLLGSKYVVTHSDVAVLFKQYWSVSLQK